MTRRSLFLVLAAGAIVRPQSRTPGDPLRGISPIAELRQWLTVNEARARLLDLPPLEVDVTFTNDNVASRYRLFPER